MLTCAGCGCGVSTSLTGSQLEFWLRCSLNAPPKTRMTSDMRKPQTAEPWMLFLGEQNTTTVHNTGNYEITLKRAQSERTSIYGKTRVRSNKRRCLNSGTICVKNGGFI